MHEPSSDMNKIKLFWVLCICFAWLSVSCSKREAPIIVVPGKSIAGVELSMSSDEVISVLGKPNNEIPSEDIGQIGEFGVLGEEKFTGKPPQMTILAYSAPPLLVVLHQDNKVSELQLGYADSVSVRGYDFLKFKYSSKEEIELIGKPSSVVRDERAEQKMLSIAPKGTKIEYYVYEYNQPELILGYVFDRIKEQSSKYFIGLNYIAVSSRKVLPPPQ